MSEHRFNNPESLFFSFRFLTNLKMLSKTMIITTRSLNHQLGVMKSHTSTWCPKNTERYFDIEGEFIITFIMLCLLLCMKMRCEICNEDFSVHNQVTIKYSKLGLEDFDFKHYNRTLFAGLEPHIPNAYCNCMIQV